MKDATRQLIPIAYPVDLRQTVAPVSWGRGKWPDHDWIDGVFVWVGWEHDAVRVRTVSQGDPRGPLEVSGCHNEKDAQLFASRVLGIDQMPPTFTDLKLGEVQRRHHGLSPYSAGSLFEGVVSSIVGQSISVASAAATQARLWALFHPGIDCFGRTFWPAPTATDLAESTPEFLRSSGITQRRANALVEIGKEGTRGNLPTDGQARSEPDHVSRVLDELPQVGPWTAQSALLWGLGLPDAHPTGDVALLRAAAAVYENSELTLRELDTLAEEWRPHRGWAARYLWTALLGSAS